MAENNKNVTAETEVEVVETKSKKAEKKANKQFKRGDLLAAP